MAAAEKKPTRLFRSGKNLYTPHGPDDYPGVVVYRGSPAWILGVLCPEVGQSLLAKGGERMLPYRTSRGAEAEGFVLAPGDRATLLRDDLPDHFAEWQVERAE